MENNETVCPNCSAPLSGTYCSSCGQRQTDLDRPFREIASEAMEAFFSFDERLVRTLWPLVARPGWLTVEYLEGRRARYLHPFKLYFAFSVALFLMISLSGYTVIRVTERDGEAITLITVNSDEEVSESETAAETGEPSIEEGTLAPLLKLLEENPEHLNQVFSDRLAKSIILLVPVFAGLLWVLYRKRRYIAHLIFSLHLHSFAFLALLIGVSADVAFGFTGGNGPGNNTATTVIAVYSFLALRRVYGRGRLATLATMVVLLLGYLAALIVTMILTLAVAVATA